MHDTLPSRTIVDAAMPWLGVAAMFVSGHFLPDIMGATGLKGAFVNGFMFAPVIGYALWRGDLRSLVRWEVLPLTLVLVWTAATGIWSEHGIDAAVSAFGIAVALAFAAIFRASPSFLASCSNAASVASVASAALVAFTTRSLLDLGFFLPMLAIFGTAATGGRLPKRALVMLPLVALSTFRAATIGCAVGAVLLTVRGTLGRLVVLIACLGVVVYVGSASERHDDASPDRADIIGRFASIQEDGASHRAELWPAILRDLEAHVDDRSVLFGRTLGDATYYIAEVFPLLAMPGHGGWVVSTHNTLLEIIVIDGLVVVPLILWALMALAMSVRLSEPSGAIAIAVGVIALANVIIYDISGGCAAIGLMMAMATPRPLASAARPIQGSYRPHESDRAGRGQSGE